jgi:hypothetical protein
MATEIFQIADRIFEKAMCSCGGTAFHLFTRLNDPDNVEAIQCVECATIFKYEVCIDCEDEEEDG